MISMGIMGNLSFYKDYLQSFFDILLLAFIIYTLLRLLIQTKATYLISAIGIFLAIYAISYIFNFTTNLWLLEKLATVLVIIIVIVFQSEFKKIFNQIGRGRFFFNKLEQDKDYIDKIYNACKNLSKKRRGALIVIEQSVGLSDITEAGTKIDGEISENLISTIFEFDTPLHDGAIIIRKGKIASAGCFLPPSGQHYLRSSYGTRHRAALGITEVSDAVVFIVSEETGAISLTYRAELFYDLAENEMYDLIKNIFRFKVDNKENFEDGVDLIK